MHGVGLALIGGFGEQLFCLLGIGLQVAETKEIPLAQLLLSTGAAGLRFGGKGFEIQGRKGCIGGLCGAQTGIGALPGKVIMISSKILPRRAIFAGILTYFPGRVHRCCQMFA